MAKKCLLPVNCSQLSSVKKRKKSLSTPLRRKWRDEVHLHSFLTSATVNKALTFFYAELCKTGFVARDACRVDRNWGAIIPPAVIHSSVEGKRSATRPGRFTAGGNRGGARCTGGSVGPTVRLDVFGKKKKNL